jgi:3-dehydroquinate synthase
VPWIQLPTTLLAMVDSSIGGKTGVDTPHGKNLVGAFHQPRVVIADVATLQSLPGTQLASGMAEVLKHAAIADPGHLDTLCRESKRILERDPETLGEVVRRSAAVKAGIVALDQHERGRRSILNFGHTVGHAVETVSGFATLHGEAVAIGMLAEAEIGRRLGITRPGAIERLRAAIATFGLPSSAPGRLEPDACLAAMRSDKKVRDGALRFALIRDLGEPARGPSGEWTVSAPPDLVLDVLGGLHLTSPIPS